MDYLSSPYYPFGEIETEKYQADRRSSVGGTDAPCGSWPWAICNHADTMTAARFEPEEREKTDYEL